METYNDSLIETVNVDAESLKNEADQASKIDEMNSEEFDKHFDSLVDAEKGTEKNQEEVVPDEVVPDYDDLYKQQISDVEAKLEKPILLKLNGKVIEIDDLNDLRNMAEQSLGVTKKFQAIAKHKETLSFLEDNGLTQDDLQQLVESRGQEPIVREPQLEEVENVANSILKSDYADEFRQSVAHMPDDFVEELKRDPAMLKALSHDFEQGLAQQILPNIEKIMATKSMSFEDAYLHLGTELSKNSESRSKQKEVLKSQPKQSNSRPASNTDVWSMDSAQFDKYFNNL